jgi:hypothetical protein
MNAAYDKEINDEKRLNRDDSGYYSAPVEGRVWGILVPNNEKHVREGDLTLHNGNRDCVCQIGGKAFARGEVRAAYFAKLTFDGEAEPTRFILKEFIDPRLRTEEEYASASENSAVANYLAEAYCSKHRVKKPIRVIRSRVLKVQRSTGVQLYNMEELLSGDFKKWTNNNGCIVQGNADIIRFSKWSFDEYDGFLMITDLQGVETSSEIILTDPAVLCQDLTRFGPTNFNNSQMILCVDAVEHWLGSGGTAAPRAGAFASLETSVYRPGYSMRSDMHVRAHAAKYRPVAPMVAPMNRIDVSNIQPSGLLMMLCCLFFIILSDCSKLLQYT